MARFDFGIFQMDRSPFSRDLQNNVFYGDGNLLAVYCLLTAWANYEDRIAPFGGKKITLRRGQVITSSIEIEAQLGISRQVVRRILKKLEEFEKINQQNNQRGTLITLLDYCDNQDFILKKNQQNNQQATNGQPTSNQRTTNDEPLRKEEREKEGRKEESNLAEPTPSDKPSGVNTDSNLLALIPSGQRQRPALIPTKSELKAEAKKIAEGFQRIHTQSLFDSYSQAYCAAYNSAGPLDNKKLRGQMKNFIDAVGEDAVLLARWYIEVERGKDGWLVAARHPFGELLKNYHTYHGNWLAGRRISHSEAKAFETQETNANAVDDYVAKKFANRRGATK